MNKQISIWKYPQIYFYLFPILILSFEMFFLYFKCVDANSFDTYSSMKMYVVICITPFCLSFMFLLKTVIHSDGIDIIIGGVKDDNSYWGIVLSRAKWENIKLFDIDYDIYKKHLRFKTGKKGRNILIKLTKRVGKTDKSLFNLWLDENRPKWFYGKKYVERFWEQVELIYKYGKKTSMSPLQKECWNSTFGPFD